LKIPCPCCTMRAGLIRHIQTKQERGIVFFSRLGPVRFSGKVRRVNQRGQVRSPGFLVCLFALTAQLSLPLLHYLHLSSEHVITQLGAGFCHSLPEHGPDAPPSTVSRDGEDRNHHHNPSHCHICQAISLSSSFAAPHHDTLSCMPLKSPEILSGGFDKLLKGRCFSDCTARAPPDLA
jgi:hypothetical protein